MASRSRPLDRAAVVRGLALALIVLGVAACGRRGALEPPVGSITDLRVAAPNAATGKPARSVATERKVVTEPTASAGPTTNATLDTPDDEAETEADAGAIGPAPIPTPAAPGSRKRGRGFTIPKDSFVLDPIL